MKVKISKLTSKDLEEIIKIEKSSFDSPWTRNAFLRDLEHNKRAFYLKMTVDNNIAAFIGCWLILDVLHIVNLAVLPLYRRQGIASRILDEALNYGRSIGANRATLEVRTENTAAVNLYKKFNFTAEGVRLDYYGPGCDALIMWKELD
ncbi:MULTISPECIES: ribosomal protein S18-alanine N-acetyltransferase [unclassified Halanaerobium]|uniref:ribosomal protein S18-alanine N-acetyltransferase n=1 Tax=unclassified Halanaerobium TaxID=2641197 RepID=UPI000E130B56|nr:MULTISPECIES: ribosomal protein S18-alanine N-acetyltransferase [unclassified Halanaerobium]RCW49246.1 [SSU ribosomal protein S18P]-alanine acetyltransferase [Halanaerobium sp. MA284_MarDTE_T2]RCW83985.1 [SSU ribosomal protein S18P]-alanine acetyltransferase [Halanaerobium sp. DL-01]